GAESSVREVVAGDVLDGPPERVRVEEDRADDALLGLEGWRGARPAHRYRHCSVMRCWSGTAEDGRAVSGSSSHRSPFSQVAGYGQNSTPRSVSFGACAWMAVRRVWASAFLRAARYAFMAWPLPRLRG